MPRKCIVAHLILLATACDTKFVATLDQGSAMQECPPSPDMSPPQAKCAAAKGLGGDNLLCVDFADILNVEDLKGWETPCASPYKWEISAGKLQIQNFMGFLKTCSLMLPAVSRDDYNKYKTFTLSVIHTVSINPTEHIAGIYLSKSMPSQRIWLFPGANVTTRQRSIIELAKAALPNGGNNTYQPLFLIDLNNFAAGGYVGWQIESIAIHGE